MAFPHQKSSKMTIPSLPHSPGPFPHSSFHPPSRSHFVENRTMLNPLSRGVLMTGLTPISVKESIISECLFTLQASLVSVFKPPLNAIKGILSWACKTWRTPS
ncbi:hypothetical protein AMTR_s00041p00091400 [Amborella trichopoda]|uniref:Uncharacterized protein n=1 Tax=Amborella trichopoda TaxID=13333 RepID=W1PYE5_AMBTC|nr:hypothetical protein AMTR_s00041p00091400 [Amborella trichopoda]